MTHTKHDAREALSKPTVEKLTRARQYFQSVGDPPSHICALLDYINQSCDPKLTPLEVFAIATGDHDCYLRQERVLTS